MKGYAEKAIKELKESGEWDGYEERINYDFDYEPKNAPSRALILIILRGETPETILINLELTQTSGKSRARTHIKEIKRQIKIYFSSGTHREREWPEAFTIREVLRNYPVISNWFYQPKQ
jgi:hypothetical protein